MQFLKLVLRNALRHRLRTALTLLGLVVAILSFGLLQTVVDAWYAGAAGAAPTRLVTRNAVSLIFHLPLSYRDQIRAVDGVRAVSYATWFAGIYQDPKNFFPQFAIEPRTYFAMYPEYLVTPQEFTALLRDRKGAVIGRKIADTYHLKIGDALPLRGTIYPGTWEFTVRAIYDGIDTKTDTSQMFFHWEYLNETMKKRPGRQTDQVGVYLVDVTDIDRVAEVSRAIDAVFKNSLAETLTETERAFQIGFVKQTEALVIAIRIVSYVVIVIILAVMANTMAMTARERLSEYATLKVLGFSPLYVAALIVGESVAIAAIGAAIGIALTFPVSDWFAATVGTLFPVFEVSGETVALQIVCALGVGMIAAAVPGRRVATMKIVEGLRAIG
ncbi:ABC transporter ATP-binding protein [Candidatus Methylomirabilis lanthanidiphila]|uniref:ABC transporter ATP-binding protein n=1 Tax=Candidatus Methylomirabilis lanthanidiphila TaxID=2211376 RepID=A0A564ZJV6_9BACT|nr:ABC transporter permease [Candidatus Methylomirabilis lanthanidiphila]VUZ85605.1 ABC transporter ATP-binding protein [Candidatus Methylomirabilis lanthanidiphila]